MPYRPPLVPHETFVADPPELPVRPPGEGGLSALARADLVVTDGAGVALKGTTDAGETLVVSIGAAAEGVLRVRLSAEADARSRSARALRLVTPVGYPEATVETGDGTVRIGAGPIVAELTLDPWHLRFLDATGRELLAQSRGERDISGRLRSLPFGRSLTDGAVVAYHESFTAPGDERFVGFGEKFTPLDKRGQRALMWNYDAFGSESDRSHKNIPLYLSSRGYGILVDTGLPAEFDVCQSTHSCVQIIVPDDLIEYYVIAGPAPADILNRYDALTTRPQLPPKWAFGTWISSGFFPDSQERVLERARRIRAASIPCDVLHLDCYWQAEGHWSDLRWDPVAFPDPAGMLATLAADGLRVCLWMNPYLSQHSPVFTEAAEAGYLLRRRDGSTYVADVWHGNFPACGIVDFTNPAAADWYADQLRPLLAQGVAAFKTDFGEGVPADAVAHNGLRGTDLHNVYALLFNDLVARVTAEAHGHHLVWARSSYLGGQRHSAQWSGDVSATWPALASTLRGGLSHGLSGVPFWSHDAGGFHGTPTPDLYARWAQFAALSPLVRFHGTTSRLPWDFPADAARIAIEALRLRYRLLPYLYSAAVHSARTGTPMLRALLVDSPNDPSAWTAELEYRLGTDLLVAPMIHPTGDRTVYLPAGAWVDHWTGTVHNGGRHIPVSKPLDRVPLYVRHGAAIPVAPAADRITDGPFPDVSIVSWGAVNGSTVIHDEDGDTLVTVSRVADRLDLSTTGPKPIRRITFAPVAGAQTPGAVTINGAPTQWSTEESLPTAALP